MQQHPKLRELIHTDVLDFSAIVAAAQTLARLNTGMTFSYVSGGHQQLRERGRSMWARVRGQTENALLRLP